MRQIDLLSISSAVRLCARGHVAHNLFEWKRCIRCTFNCAHAVSVYTGGWYDI